METTATLTTEKTTILIVDDRQENILTLENIIAQDDRIILTAISGNEALKTVISKPVDILLIDVQMPEMDGYEVADLMRINPRTKHIPIVFVSAVTREEKKQLHKYEPGTVDFLYKPLDLEETRSKIFWIEKLIRQSKAIKKLSAEVEKLKEDYNRFTYLVTHDVKAPIRAIDNLINWIVEDMGSDLPPAAADNLSLLRNRVNRTQCLLNALTDYSRISRTTEGVQPVDVRKLLFSVIESLPVPDSFGVEVVGCNFVFQAEKDLLTRVFTELIKNATMHHGQPRGTIRIMCEEQADKYIFSVWDDGPGIPRHQEEKAFEIFQTLKPNDDANYAGVGLPIAKRIVENLGHKIWIDRMPPHGFEIKFSWHK